MENTNEVLPMTAELMPEAWFDDQRMNSMFAEFRNRSVNPQDWNSKYKFWDGLITDWLSDKKQCTFTIFQLSTIFKRKGRTPRCLSIVIEELYKKGEIITEEEFLNEVNLTWTSWAINTMVKKPVVWSFSKMKNYLIPPANNSDMEYIHLRTLKEIAHLILSLPNDEKELILSVPEITKKCSEKCENKNINEENIKLALFWLTKSKKGLSLPHYHEKWDCILKISKNGVEELTEAEKGLFKLKESERILLEKIENLEIEQNNLQVKAKTSLNNGLKEVAKTHLRKKKELDKRIEKHAATLQNLQTLISNIHDAHSNSDVLAAYKKGAEILKSFEKTGLNEFVVRDTMDDMTEAIGEYREIQSALSENIKLNDSDNELEEELEKIMNSSNQDLLPNVPDNSIPDLEKELESLKFHDFPSTPKKPLQQNN